MKNMRLATKLALGFGIVVMVLIALGVTGFSMFRQVDTSVQTLSKHSLAAVKNSTGVERKAYDCILDEKNYLLNEKDEIHQKAQKDLKDLLGNLDEVDKVAAEFSDEALGGKSKEVRSIATQYGQLYDRGVAALKGNNEASETMRAKGDLVGSEANAYMSSKKAEYLEAKDALAVVNRINALALETRMNEKAYILYKQQKYFDVIEKNIAELAACYGDLEKLHPDATEQKQITDARKATKDYFEAAKAWVATQKKGAADQETMVTKGQLVSSEANTYLAAKKTEYEEAKDALAIVNRINALALETRMSEKSFMMYKQQKYFDVIDKNIADLLKCYDQLEKLHPDTNELKQITDARKATKDYFEAAKAWVAEQKSNATSARLAELAKTMDDTGNTVGKCAADYLAVKQARTDKVADAVFIVADIAQQALDARRLSNRYFLYQEQKDWEGILADITKLTNLYEDLRKVSITKDDQDRIERADRATQEYKAAATSWVENDKQMKIAAATMDNGGNTVGTAAATYQANKQTNVGKVADAVFFVADVAQTALATRLHADEYMLHRKSENWTGLTENCVKLDKLYDDLRKVSLTGEDQQRIERADKATTEYLSAAKAWVDNDNQLRQAILPKMRDIGESVLNTARTAEEDAWKGADTNNASVTGIVGSSKFIITTALIIGVIVGLGASILVTRSITKPFKDIFKGLKTFSTKELRETGDTFRQIIDGLTTGAEQVASASGQVASASQSSAQGASEQASSLEETTSALEEMSSMSKTNADNAGKANDLMSQTTQIVNQGQNVMRQTSDAMGKISDASSKIANIIKVIEEIAFQTNLLALNAAVEAARAGEHGKGFAVVADEAQRSAKAANETAQLISDTIERVKKGNDLNEELSKSFVQVNESASQVALLVEQIATASKEQAKGVDQINAATGQMDKVVQSSAAGAEESASASEELSSQAQVLRQTVDQLAVLVGGDQARSSGDISGIRSSRKTSSSSTTQPHTNPSKQNTEIHDLKSKTAINDF
jgi:methyl-accepting chemotaxis protein